MTDRAGCFVWLAMFATGAGVAVALNRAGVSDSMTGMVATLAALAVPLVAILPPWADWTPRARRERRRQREADAARLAAAEAAREARRRRPCATMPRATLIDHLAEFARFHPARVIMAGMDTADLRELCAGRRDWSGLLPGEKRDGWSVYRIRFDDGAAYVGMTRLTVIDRLYRHLDGTGGAGIRHRYKAGMGYRFDVLASGLTEPEARRHELAEIARLHQPLNVIGARGPHEKKADGEGQMPSRA